MFDCKAPWFKYGPYQAPNGNWYAGYVTASGQYHLEFTQEETFKTKLEARAFFFAHDCYRVLPH